MPQFNHEKLKNKSSSALQDAAASEIVLEERGGARRSVTLRRPITQITHIGYSTLDAVTEFSHWKAAN